MNLTQAVRHIASDTPAGYLFVQHVEGQISADSDALISEDSQPIPGYVQVASCLAVWGMYGDLCGVECVVERLVKMHNGLILSR